MTNNINAGLTPAQEVAYQSYRDCFAQPEHNPFSGDYTEVLAPYRIPLANQDVPTQANVQTLSLNCASQNVPTAFLLQHNDGLLHVYLQLAKFHTCMGLPATTWDEQMYCQKGELYHNQSADGNLDSSLLLPGEHSNPSTNQRCNQHSLRGRPRRRVFGTVH